MNTIRTDARPLTMVARGLRLRCPRCGGGKLFQSWFKLKARCPTCGYKIEREEGFWLGGYVMNTALGEGLLVTQRLHEHGRADVAVPFRMPRDGEVRNAAVLERPRVDHFEGARVLHRLFAISSHIQYLLHAGFLELAERRTQCALAFETTRDDVGRCAESVRLHFGSDAHDVIE